MKTSAQVLAEIKSTAALLEAELEAALRNEEEFKPGNVFTSALYTLDNLTVPEVTVYLHSRTVYNPARKQLVHYLRTIDKNGELRPERQHNRSLNGRAYTKIADEYTPGEKYTEYRRNAR